MHLTGYADKFAVHPGETIDFFVNCAEGGEYRAEIVELVHGDTNPRGPGFIERLVESSVDGKYEGRPQTIHSGSYGFVADSPALHVRSFTLQCWVWPTMPKTEPQYWRHGSQGIITHWAAGRGYGLFIDEVGIPELRVNGQVLKGKLPLRDHAWHFLAATYDAETGEAVLYHEPQVVYALDLVEEPARAVLGEQPWPVAVPLVIAGCVQDGGGQAKRSAQTPSGFVMGNHYNGKIDSPRLSKTALSRVDIEAMKTCAGTALSERRHTGPSDRLAKSIVAIWDFSVGIPTLMGHDVGPFSLHLTLVNCPARALTGFNWTGHNFDWKSASHEYGAIHFHDDDLDDARWEVDFCWTVPEGTKSRFYAAKLTTAGGAEDYIPFWVVPRLEEAKAKIGFMVPTLTYMAYANEHLATNAAGAELLYYRTPIIQEQNIFLSQHREYGCSNYDTHTDGSGVHFSSRLRPILNMRPKYDSPLAQGPWGFSSDLYLVYWLDKMGYDYEVFTDEDVIHEGLARLEKYNVVLTGSHPEYVTGSQLDALQDYTQRGGRLMYMGGDGFYWVYSLHPAYDAQGRGILGETRRLESGLRTWEADPGEYYHQSTGELGGMWRYRGRYIQAVAGTGMAAQGFDIGTYFTRTRESLDPRVSWAFEGIGYEEKIGNFGLSVGGAAGLEVDIVDTMLGSPPHILTVATSVGQHTEAYLLVTEDYRVSQAGIDGTQHPRVRADMAFHETPNGGACFAFSSISFVGSLPWNNGDNNVSRLVKNVLDRFGADGPLPPAPAEASKVRGRADYRTPVFD